MLVSVIVVVNLNDTAWRGTASVQMLSRRARPFMTTSFAALTRPA